MSSSRKRSRAATTASSFQAGAPSTSPSTLLVAAGKTTRKRVSKDNVRAAGITAAAAAATTVAATATAPAARRSTAETVDSPVTLMRYMTKVVPSATLHPVLTAPPWTNGSVTAPLPHMFMNMAHQLKNGAWPVRPMAKGNGNTIAIDATNQAMVSTMPLPSLVASSLNATAAATAAAAAAATTNTTTSSSPPKVGGKGTPPPADTSNAAGAALMTSAQKKSLKREANRKSAHKCRMRKKQAIEAIREENLKLHEELELLHALPDMVFSFVVTFDSAGAVHNPPRSSFAGNDKKPIDTFPLHQARNSCNSQYAILFVSNAVHKTLQYEEHELLNRSFFDILSFDSREQLDLIINTKLEKVAAVTEEFRSKEYPSRDPREDDGLAVRGAPHMPTTRKLRTQQEQQQQHMEEGHCVDNLKRTASPSSLDSASEQSLSNSLSNGSDHNMSDRFSDQSNNSSGPHSSSPIRSGGSADDISDDSTDSRGDVSNASVEKHNQGKRSDSTKSNSSNRKSKSGNSSSKSDDSSGRSSAVSSSLSVSEPSSSESDLSSMSTAFVGTASGTDVSTENESQVFDLCTNLRVQMMRKDGTVVTATANGVLSMSVDDGVRVVCTVRPCHDTLPFFLVSNPDDHLDKSGCMKPRQLKDARSLDPKSTGVILQQTEPQMHTRTYPTSNSTGSLEDLQGERPTAQMEAISGQVNPAAVVNNSHTSTEESNGSDGGGHDGDVEDVIDNVDAEETSSSGGSEKL